VQAAADPAGGAAPLTVSFTAAGRDPDGDALSYVWSFGDGGQAGGPKATHTFAQAGTYTVTVTARDASGATGTASVQVVVSAPAALRAVAAPQAGDDVAAVRSPRSVRALRTHGVRVTVTCVADGKGRAVLALARKSAARIGLRKRTLAVRTVDCAAGQTVKVRLKPGKAALRKLRGERAIRLVLRVRVEDAEPLTRRLTIR
jgi:hypothetical protein